MSLLKLRNRFKTVKSLNSIFTALQVVTVVRTQRVRERFFALERYLEPQRAVLRGRVKAKAARGKILVVVTSNRGLCGNFNKAAVGIATKFLKENPGTELVVLGRTGQDLFRRRGTAIKLFNAAAVEKPNFAGCAALFKKLDAFGAELHVAYNSYRSAIQQIPTICRLTPVPEELAAEQKTADFILEPNREKLTAELFYHYLESRFFQLVMESQLGELGARFMVLKGAVDSSKEMGESLTLQINKARQSNITRDLLEIVSAAEAVRSDNE
jgi:F-type H+-transporting ATPase subunit gamma